MQRRKFIHGKAAEDIGGPHVKMDMIWPMPITMRGLTHSSDESVIKKCINDLKNTLGSTGFIHESFHKDNPKNFPDHGFPGPIPSLGNFCIRNTLNCWAKF